MTSIRIHTKDGTFEYYDFESTETRNKTFADIVKKMEKKEKTVILQNVHYNVSNIISVKKEEH